MAMKSNQDKQTKHIVAVDDVPDNLSLLAAIFDESLYSLNLVDSGWKAINLIAQDPPDLILLDLMMPEMDGFEVAQHIRQDDALPYIPIVLMTAHSQISVEKGLAVGVDGFVRKPFDIDELQGLVKQLVYKLPRCLELEYCDFVVC